MTAALRKLTLGCLYVAVALLIAVPPVIILSATPACGDPPCVTTSRQFFTAEAAIGWLVPFSIAAVLLAVAFRIKARR